RCSPKARRQPCSPTSRYARFIWARNSGCSAAYRRGKLFRAKIRCGKSKHELTLRRERSSAVYIRFCDLRSPPIRHYPCYRTSLQDRLLKPALHLRLNQQLALTPQLQQAIRLLQLSSVELEMELQEALESNPLLEMAELSER